MKKKFNIKGSFQCFYIPVFIWFSLLKIFFKLNQIIIRNIRNYYPKMVLEKFSHKFFWRSIINFGFQGFGSSSWNIGICLGPELESSIS